MPNLERTRKTTGAGPRRARAASFASSYLRSLRILQTGGFDIWLSPPLRPHPPEHMHRRRPPDARHALPRPPRDHELRPPARGQSAYPKNGRNTTASHIATLPPRTESNRAPMGRPAAIPTAMCPMLATVPPPPRYVAARYGDDLTPTRTSPRKSRSSRST